MKNETDRAETLRLQRDFDNCMAKWLGSTAPIMVSARSTLPDTCGNGIIGLTGATGLSPSSFYLVWRTNRELPTLPSQLEGGQHMATGKINSITPTQSGCDVSVTIQTDAIGPWDLTISVDGPSQLAAEQARRKLYELGAELAQGFDHQGSLRG